MNVTRLELDSLVLVGLTIHGDSGGFFTKRFHLERFRAGPIRWSG